MESSSSHSTTGLGSPVAERTACSSSAARTAHPGMQVRPRAGGAGTLQAPGVGYPPQEPLGALLLRATEEVGGRG